MDQTRALRARSAPPRSSTTSGGASRGADLARRARRASIPRVRVKGSPIVEGAAQCREDERGASWFRPGGLDAEKSLLSHASGIQVLGP